MGEKLRGRRYPVAWKARVRAAGVEESTVAHVANISVSGALLQLPCTYERGETLAVEIQIAPDLSVACKAHVVRTGAPLDDAHPVGVIFTDFAADGREKLGAALLILLRGAWSGDARPPLTAASVARALASPPLSGSPFRR